MKKFEEKFENCVLLSQIQFFLVAADFNNHIEDELQTKIMNIIAENHLFDEKNTGLFGKRVWQDNNLKNRIKNSVTKILVKCFSKFNSLFSIFFTEINSNPKAVYQKWCEAFQNLTENEIQIIENASKREGNDYHEYAVFAWNLIKEQNGYLNK